MRPLLDAPALDPATVPVLFTGPADGRLPMTTRTARCWAVLLVPAMLLSPPVAHAEKWPAIPPEQLALEHPEVDRQADAEALFWEIRAEDVLQNVGYSTHLWHHVRIKVFTERGRESQSRIDLTYDRDEHLDEISARSVSPSGQVVELASGDVHERTLVKANHVRIRAKSFVIPGVEVGSIVEYRWHESRGLDSRRLGLIELQRDIPVQRITCRIKPIAFTGAPPLQYQAFNAAPTPLEALGMGVFSTTLNRVPAFVEEPDMPREREARKWMILFYAGEDLASPVERWRNVARQLASHDEDLRRAGRELKGSAAEIVGDAQDPEERLRRLYAFCRTRIVNLQSKASGLTEEERARLKPNGHPQQTLEAKRGTGADINDLFAALAWGAGFEVRQAKLSDREFIFFRPSMLPWFLTSRNVAVRIGDAWRFFDAASPNLPFGMLRWQEEDLATLVEEKGEPVWLKTPLSPASRSGVERVGSFRLLEDGTLEGEARIEFSGHTGIEEKSRVEESSAEERAQALRDLMKERMPAAELTDVRYECPADPESSLAVSFRLRVPAYAKTTGRRLFIQPGVFQYGRGPRFAVSERRNAVDLHFPWSERDSLVIELPAGYELESPDVPADFDVPDVCHFGVVLGTRHEGSQIVYRRRLRFDRYYFDRQRYDGVKAVFDVIHENDQHTLAVRQGAGSGH